MENTRLTAAVAQTASVLLDTPATLDRALAPSAPVFSPLFLGQSLGNRQHQGISPVQRSAT